MGDCVLERWRHQGSFEYLVHREPVPILPSSLNDTGVLNSHHQAAQAISPAQWASVEVALIRSIRKGVLFDRKYWARHSKRGDVLKPVYFSSIIVGDKVQQLSNRMSKFCHGFAGALRVRSGEIPQWSKYSHE